MTTTIDTSTGGLKRQKDDLPAGRTLDRYRIEEPVGRGGMGTVYRAFDEQTNRFVALKLLAEGIPESLRERFLAECEAEAAIRHEHVMPVYDRGWLSPERPYFVMELVYEPVTLDVVVELAHNGKLASTYPRLRRWANPRQLIADVILPIVDGIDTANQTYKIQHRDIKPENVLIDVRTRRAYVIDFGICRPMDEVPLARKIVGTPRFLSPEQAAARVDPRTDVWGLGNLVRYIYSGEPPIGRASPFSKKDVAERIDALKKAEAKAETAGELAKARGYTKRREQLESPDFRTQDDMLSDARNGVYPPLPDVMGSSLGAIVSKAMAVSPEERYATAGALKDDLERWLRGETSRAVAEGGAGSATVDRAFRWLHRHRAHILATLAGLATGLVLGMVFLARDPLSADMRAGDAVSGLEELSARWATVEDADSIGRVGARAWMHNVLAIRRDAKDLEAQIALLPAGPQRESLRAKLDALSLAWEPKRLACSNGTVTGRLKAVDASVQFPKEQVTATGMDTLALPPGIFRITSSRVNLHVLRAPSPSGSIPPQLHFGAAIVRHPEGTVWVPATQAQDKADAPKPFVASVELVTNSDYEAWLAEIEDDAERRRRVPPSGFERDRSGTKMWLATVDARSRPVQGIRPEDAAAYAAWRASIEELPYRLPTESEWRRMAGEDYLDHPGSDVFFGRNGARRDGMTRPPNRSAPSPMGISQLVTHADGELVTDSKGAYVLKHHPRGWITRKALDARTPIESNNASTSLVFRLVIAPK